MLLELIMSFGVQAFMCFWSLGFFEVLIPLWSLGLFSYPQLAPVLSLTHSFYSRGARIRIAIGLGLVIMISKKFIQVLESVPNIKDSWVWLCTQFVKGGAGNEAFQPFLSFFSSESVTPLLASVQFPLNVKETIFLAFNLVSFLYTVFSLSRMRAEISRGTDETPEPSMENPEWGGEWEDMGQILKEFSDPVVWDFPHEQILNPAEMGKYLKEKCQVNSKEKKIIAVSWALAYAYRALLDTVGQQTGGRGQGDKSTATPITQAAANLPVTKLVAKPDSKPQPMAVATSTRSGKCTNKTDQPGTDCCYILYISKGLYAQTSL
ncbi:uncharacterized protein LOC131592509 [Poecile atricapillus]|uniref:uncharacterized protein LOC131592509 n=1 Tax=Poecile atricapillus TaxID=48891 RepID=UPI002739520D|nr:uncharacterized protein LOC131592509 [Poecile atricapillus]XP_058720055.1 uncharacterized protein LOC131592509 [Poecile atricapillus]